MIVGYRDDMFFMLEDCLLKGTKCNLTPSTAPTLASTGEQLSRQDVIARQTTRGLTPKDHYIQPSDIEEEGARRK